MNNFETENNNQVHEGIQEVDSFEEKKIKRNIVVIILLILLILIIGIISGFYIL